MTLEKLAEKYLAKEEASLPFRTFYSDMIQRVITVKRWKMLDGLGGYDAKGETIWIEEIVQEEDLPFILSHEFFEIPQTEILGIPYEEADKNATQLEDQLVKFKGLNVEAYHERISAYLRQVREREPRGTYPKGMVIHTGDEKK